MKTVKLVNWGIGNLPATLVSDWAETKAIGYGWTLQGESIEWQIVVLATSRQDGRTAWQVSLVEVDGGILTEEGLDPTPNIPDRIERAIGTLTRRAGWIEPFNEPFVEE